MLLERKFGSHRRKFLVVWIGVHIRMMTIFGNGSKGNKMHMRMRHINTNDLDANIGNAQRLANMAPYLFDRRHEMLIIFVIQIPHKFDLLFGDNQGVTRGNRVNIEEHIRMFVLIDFMARDFAFDDFRKD